MINNYSGILLSMFIWICVLTDNNIITAPSLNQQSSPPQINNLPAQQLLSLGIQLKYINQQLDVFRNITDNFSHYIGNYTDERHQHELKAIIIDWATSVFFVVVFVLLIVSVISCGCYYTYRYMIRLKKMKKHGQFVSTEESASDIIIQL